MNYYCKVCHKEIGYGGHVRGDLCTKCKAKETRRAKEQAYKDCGLVKVKGALGGTYWE